VFLAVAAALLPLNAASAVCSVQRAVCCVLCAVCCVLLLFTRTNTRSPFVLHLRLRAHPASATVFHQQRFIVVFSIDCVPHPPFLDGTKEQANE
jgi:hypothetical protein